MVELQIIGGTDKTVRFAVVLKGEPVGELQTNRDDFTKLADLLLEKNYRVVSNVPQLA